MVKLCIFDLDGVLCDTAKYHFLAWRRLAEELGFVFTKEDNERLKGVSRMASLEILLEIGHVTAKPEQKLAWAEKKNRWYVEFIQEMPKEELYPGVREFLTGLRENGILTALGSASKNAGIILDRLEIRELFDAIVDGTQVAKAKPEPDVFEQGAGLLKIPPENSVVFEDARAGVEAAHRAGMVCVGIGSREVLREADMVVPSLGDISDLSEWKRQIEGLQEKRYGKMEPER